MALPQEIRPINSELMDAITASSDADWIPNPDDPERAFMRVLWTGEESGRWMVHFRWLKGYVAPPHKHLSAAHTYILSGKLKVRGGTFNAGDYVHEANGMVHGATTALEDTEYLFMCDGPVIFFGKDEFTGYLGWEEIRRMQQAHEASKKKAAARKRSASKKGVSARKRTTKRKAA